MRLEYYSVEKLKKDISNIVRNHIEGEVNVFFFGSRVNGKGDERSDIDIGILGKGAISLNTMLKIKEDIDNLPILYKIDFVDFNSVSESFKSVALNKIEIING